MLPKINMILLALTAASTVAPALAQTGDGQSGVSGVVSVSPGCPSPQRAGVDCVKPFPGAEVRLRDAGGAVVGHATADSSGNYRIVAPAGHYDLQVQPQAGNARCGTLSADVLNDKVARLDVTCDSSLR